MLIVLGVLALAFAGLVIYDVIIGLPDPQSEVPLSEPLSEETKKTTPCFFTRDPVETWPDETVSDPPIGNVELIKSSLVETYDIFGLNLSEVLDSMNKNGPIIIKQKVPTINMSVEGVAYAEGLIDSTWHRKETAAGCILTGAEETIDIMLILPKWVDKVSASDQDQKMWDLYLTFLKRHEQGHINIALKAAREWQAELAQPISAPSCQGLDDKIKVLYNEIMQTGKEATVNYDQRTNHGLTQRPDLFTCDWRELKI